MEDLNSPVCPLTPRAAPVAVNSTIASRRSWMLACKVAFCSAVNWGLLGSRESLFEILENGVNIDGLHDQLYFLNWVRSMGNFDMVEVDYQQRNFQHHNDFVIQTMYYKEYFSCAFRCNSSRVLPKPACKTSLLSKGYR